MPPRRGHEADVLRPPFRRVVTDTSGATVAVNCVFASEVPVEDLARAYAELQSQSPVLAALGCTYEDRVEYGRFLARHCRQQPSVAAVTADTSAPRVVGICLGMGVDPATLDASSLPPSAAAHWALCCRVSGQVAKRLASRKGGVHGDRTVAFAAFGGVVEELRGSGLWQSVSDAHRFASRRAGHSHVWGFTFSKAVITGALSPGSPYVSGRMSVVAPLLRAVGPALFSELPATVLMAGISSLSLFGFVPRKVMTWGYPCASFQHDGRRPLRNTDGVSIIIITVMRLNDPSWPEQTSNL